MHSVTHTDDTERGEGERGRERGSWVEVGEGVVAGGVGGGGGHSHTDGACARKRHDVGHTVTLTKDSPLQRTCTCHSVLLTQHVTLCAGTLCRSHCDTS